jgi:hypothetical protein
MRCRRPTLATRRAVWVEKVEGERERVNHPSHSQVSGKSLIKTRHAPKRSTRTLGQPLHVFVSGRRCFFAHPPPRVARQPMALCLPGRALPVTAAAAPSSRILQPPSATAARARMAAAPNVLLAAGRRRLGAAVSSVWTVRGASSASAASRTMTVRTMAAASSSDASREIKTKGVTDVVGTTDAEGAGARNGGYPFADIEARWQKHWADNKTFKTPEKIDTTKPKFYALDMFPYPRCVNGRDERELPTSKPQP